MLKLDSQGPNVTNGGFPNDALEDYHAICHKGSQGSKTIVDGGYY